jgi:hypothetical protein
VKSQRIKNSPIDQQAPIAISHDKKTITKARKNEKTKEELKVIQNRENGYWPCLISFFSFSFFRVFVMEFLARLADSD